MALPSGLESKIAAIHTMTGELEEAFPPQSVTITLEDDIDISRGDVLVRPENRPEGQQDLDVMLCWLNANPPRPRAKYVIKHTTAEARAMITEDSIQDGHQYPPQDGRGQGHQNERYRESKN